MNIDGKKINGVVYTPEWIVNLILDKINYKDDILNKRIVDPACGEGAFLTVVLERFIKDAVRSKKEALEIKKILAKNICGFEIDQRSVDVCKANLQNIATSHGIKNVKWNIVAVDSLDKQSIEKYLGKFDFVVGNPPYVRIQHLGASRREKIQKAWSFCKNGSTDIFIAFFELGYGLLTKTGKLGYITPNTYLKTKAGEILRSFIKYSKTLKILIDFGHHQLFDNATTYSLITILDKGCNSNTFRLFKGDKEKISFVDEINIESLNNDNWTLTSNDTLEKLNIIEKRGLPLCQIAEIHVGVTTLADDYYIFENPVFEGDMAEISLKDGRTFHVEKGILKPIIKASVLKDAKEDQNRFIIFPYQVRNGKHVIIAEKDLKNNFPFTYKYFNSIKEILDRRDKGKPNSVAWYAFGRSQGLDTSFGKKILTSPMNLKPNFIVWEKEEYTFYAGYCIKFDGDANLLAKYLNSEDMEFYINHISRSYQHNYKSFAKTFIEKFSIRDASLIKAQKQGQLLAF